MELTGPTLETFLDKLRALGIVMEDGTCLLLERRYPEIDQFKVEIFPNEGRHRGFPHCRVTTDKGAVTVSIEACEIVAGDAGHWNRSIMRSVADHQQGLLDFWNEMRPDDQKLD